MTPVEERQLKVTAFCYGFGTGFATTVLAFLAGLLVGHLLLCPGG
jgi:hypothetical protein